MAQPLVLSRAPLPRDLRQLIELREFTRSKVADNSGLQPQVVNQILDGELIPSVPQVRAICHAVGVRCCRKIVALATRYDSPEANSYMGKPEFQALRAYGQRYLRRKLVSILKLARPKWPLFFHTLSVTYDRLGKPEFNEKTGEWEEAGELWDLVQLLVREGVLRPIHDRSGLYVYCWATCDDDVDPLEEDSKGRVRRRRGSNVVFSMCPRPKKNKKTGKWELPKRRLCRLHISDVYREGSPVGKLWPLLVDVDGMETLRFTRLDLAAPVLNDPRVAALPIGSGRGSKRERRLFDDLFVARCGPKGQSFGILYQDLDKGYTQVESRDWYDPTHPTKYKPEYLYRYPNPFAAWVQWNLRSGGVVDRRLYRAVVRAQSEGVRSLPNKGPAKVLREALQVSYRDEDGEWVHPDPNHPANVFERHYHDELRRLAKRLNVRPVYFGLDGGLQGQQEVRRG